MQDLATNKYLAVHWLELINDGDARELAELTSPTWRMWGGPPQLPRGQKAKGEGSNEGRCGDRQALLEAVGSVDQTWTIDDVVAENDRVVIRATNNCMQDSFLGVPAAGVRQVYTATFILRIEGGQVAEIWRNADDLGRLLQLGAQIVPPEPGHD